MVSYHKVLRLARALSVPVEINEYMIPAARYVPPVWNGRPMAGPRVEINPRAESRLGTQPGVKRIIHELAHYLGPDIDTYHKRRGEHEVYAQSVVVYATRDYTRYDEDYLNDWYLNGGKVDLDRVRAMVQIVGEHVRAALEVEE